jgi:hypothetical protein
MGIFIRYSLGHGRMLGFIPTFDFDGEKNVPALYSAVAITACGFLLWKISKLVYEQEKRNSLSWKALSFIFYFLAIDEYFSIHEEFRLIMSSYLNGGSVGGGWQTFRWYVPYMLIFGFVSIFFTSFFFRLPAKTRIQFSVAGFVYIFGAVGMEMVSSKYFFLTGRYDT